ncbi:MAG: AmmeMemoRadiSam system radical SAM enzyme [Bacteroidales bacterium]|nr:AmmeMemoRadiSam system radical SAM enzyme [Bacteroidales bacterium]
MQEALFYEKTDNDEVICRLCPQTCRLKPGQTGNCRVRENVGGTLYTHVYNKVAAIGVDPVEKKPLYHFYPGMEIFSVGEVGCNLHCSFCQNYGTSQCFASDFGGFHEITPVQLVEKAQRGWHNIGIAYTYNEPFTFYEFMTDIARLAHDKGMKNVVVSNGYINPEPLSSLIPLIDAFNIDLKSFDDSFYRKQVKGNLGPVLESLQIIARSGKHLEITNLVITELNDGPEQFEAMVKWISKELGEKIPLHISRYFPQYRLNLPPTPLENLHQLYTLAKKYLHHVYLGNVPDDYRSSTYCPNCGALLVEREHYRIKIIQQGFKGYCTECNTDVNILI